MRASRIPFRAEAAVRRRIDALLPSRERSTLAEGVPFTAIQHRRKVLDEVALRLAVDRGNHRAAG
jgi:hypothetical protein